MRIEHVNIIVPEIEPTMNFLLAAFPQWRLRGRGDMTWYGKPRSWAHVGNDDFYITLNDHGEGQMRDLTSNQNGLAHVGFAVENVDQIVKNLISKGYNPDHTGGTHPFHKSMYFIDPQGLEFEFVEYSSEIPAEKNMYVEKY